MRVVVSGTHASGKSRLVADLADVLPDVEVLPDPYELVAEESLDEPDAELFHDQLVVAAARLRGCAPQGLVLAERGPVDLLAYLVALVELDRPGRDEHLVESGRRTAAAAMAGVDLVVLLDPADVAAPEDEDPELRAATDDALRDLLDDPDLAGSAVVVEVAGDPASRVRQVLEAMGQARGD